MRELVFVDTETTGLDVETEELVELTFATLTSEPETLWFGVTEVKPFVDDLIGFTKRGLSGRRSEYPAVERFLAVSDNATMVAANPAFDAGFIKAAGLWRFHYRMLDIESYAMARLDTEDVPSMKEISDILAGRGLDLTKPDHTSRNDVLAMREAFIYLASV